MYLEIFLADFAVFRVFLGISRVCDRVKYQKPCFMEVSTVFHMIKIPSNFLKAHGLIIVIKPARPCEKFWHIWHSCTLYYN